jgi:hypothetical protein
MAEGAEPTIDSGMGDEATDHDSYSDIGGETTDEGFKTGIE